MIDAFGLKINLDFQVSFTHYAMQCVELGVFQTAKGVMDSVYLLGNYKYWCTRCENACPSTHFFTLMAQYGLMVLHVI